MIACKILMDEKEEVTMPRKAAGPPECVKKKASQLKPLESRNALEGFPAIKEDNNSLPADFFHSIPSVNKEGFGTMHQVRNSPFHRPEFLMCPIIYPALHMPQQGHVNIFDSHFFLTNREAFYPSEHKIHYLPFRMVPGGSLSEIQLQEFHYFVVIDFEATCDKNKNLHPQEIIEFPSVLVNSSTGLLEASFQTYVRPTYHQLLTDFCKELTGIQQIQVDRGVSLSDALLLHDKWLEDIGIKQKNFAVVTWSDWDCRVMLESECRFKGIRKPNYFNKWINLKVPFQEAFGGARCNLKEAVQLAGLAWEGRAHCGLDDARNTARLLSLLMRRGFRLSITNSLKTNSAESPPKKLEVASSEAQPVKPKEKMTGEARPFHPAMERAVYCFCGVPSSRCAVRKPGPMQGRWFFGCGKWTASRRAVCDYFVWACP